jgi:hypothetical protein
MYSGYDIPGPPGPESDSCQVASLQVHCNRDHDMIITPAGLPRRRRRPGPVAGRRPPAGHGLGGRVRVTVFKFQVITLTASLSAVTGRPAIQATSNLNRRFIRVATVFSHGHRDRDAGVAGSESETVTVMPVVVRLGCCGRCGFYQLASKS